MAFTIQDVCDLARTELNDDAKVRYSDVLLEKWANAALQLMSLLAPHLFTTVAAVTPTPDQCQQDLRTANDLVLALYNILTVVGGNAVFECDFYQMLAFTNNAMTQASAAPVNWSRQPADKDKQSSTRYFLFPPPVTGTSLLVEFAAVPAYITLANPTPVAIAYRPAIANYIKGRANAVDDESVAEQKAAAELTSFMGTIGAGVQTKQIATEGTA